VGAQEALTRPDGPDSAAHGGARVGARVGSRRPPTRGAFVVVAAASSLLLIWLSRGVFLYWDDFLFLGEARSAEFGRAYLDTPLFTHFSPVTRLFNWGVEPVLAEHPWVVPAVLSVLLVSVVSAVTWLMVVLFGRTRTALVGAVLLAPSLTLVPLGNWWTAGINILPALAGFALAFGALVQVVRGHSRWWALPCLLGAVVGVLDYELPMLLVGYLGLWVLLFRSRVTDEPLWALVRRTWWLWAGVLVVDVLAAANYRLNYYTEVPSPDTATLVHALGRSLVRTLVPTAVGLHDPRSELVSTLSLVVGCLTLAALVGWLLTTRVGAWRGLLFAAVGWALPTLALIVNRVDLYGVEVVDNAIYFFLPTALAVIGVLEASLAPRREGVPSFDVTRGPGRVVVSTAALAVVLAYAASAGPTARYQHPPGAGPDFVDTARSSAAALDGSGPVNVLDSDVPETVIPPGFAPYNRASNVLGLTVPGLVFDDPAPPYHRVDAEGVLHEVAIDWQVRTPDLGRKMPQVAFRDVQDLELADGKACFTTGARTAVIWNLPSTVPGQTLVVGIDAAVAASTPVKVSVLADGAEQFEAANYDRHELRPGQPPSLETVAPTTIRVLQLNGLDEGVDVCVRSLQVGLVTEAG